MRSSSDRNHHIPVFLWNSTFILWELAQTDIPDELRWYLRLLSTRLEQAQKSLRILREVHRDIVAFFSLYIDGRYDFNQTVKPNFFEILTDFNKSLPSTEPKVQILQTWEDASISIEHEWAKPPFKELQKTADIWLIVHSLLNHNPDWIFANPTEQQFYEFVDRLRESVWDNYEANQEIDRIMQLKDDFWTKLTLLQNSQILKPFIA